MDDEQLLRAAEAALAEIDRSQGLNDEHADVLAALRIRIHGAPRGNLDDLLKAAGPLKGRRPLDETLDAPPRKPGSFEDVLHKPPKKPDWPGL